MGFWLLWFALAYPDHAFNMLFIYIIYCSFYKKED